uniref:Uncharacterized protein n=1 Tax=Glycine max TaxID=3847 RepID=C6TEU0_SOYBN|nr:unknown [Glycine max]
MTELTNIYLKLFSRLFLIHDNQNLPTMHQCGIQELPNFICIKKGLRGSKVTVQVIPNPINLPQCNPVPTSPDPSKPFQCHIDHNPHQNILRCININGRCPLSMIMPQYTLSLLFQSRN